MTIFRAPRRLLSAIALAALLGASCSSSNPSSTSPAPAGGADGNVDPLAMIASASDRIDEATALEMEFTMAISAGGQDVTGSGSAVASSDGSRMRMDMHYDSFPGMADGFSMELILDGGTMYMSTATFEAAGAPTDAFAGKGWVAFDLDKIVPGYESFADLGSGQNDPSQAFEYLKGAGDLEVVGTEEIDGEETTHLRGTLDLERALEQVPAEAQEEFRTTLEEFRTQFGDVTMPFEVWVDGEDRIRRMIYVMASAPDAPQPVSFEMTLDITDYDAALDFDVPARSETVDLADLVAANGG